MSSKNPLGGHSDEEIWARQKDAEAIEKMREKNKKGKDGKDGDGAKDDGGCDAKKDKTAKKKK
ncbi:MAG: hypothetical protein KC777_24680 [Cyanobacteria bacterium HKST-UBA02]|nr:hypothetical protein [Cyanobacteria bacterium HKST-UBA02]